MSEAETGHALHGAYELYCDALPQEARERILHELDEQKQVADRITHLRITMLESALHELWSAEK